MPGGEIKPDAVLQNRAAEPGIDVPVRLDTVRRGEAAGSQGVGQVVALQSAGGVRAEHDPVERIAPFLEDVVGADPARVQLGVVRPRVNLELLDAHRIHGEDRGRGTDPETGDRNAIQRRRGIFRVGAMGGHVAGGGGRSRAADILPPEVDPRDQRAQRGPGSARREGIEDVTIRTSCRVALCRSTIGVSPVTVIVSSIPPTRRSALIRR